MTRSRFSSKIISSHQNCTYLAFLLIASFVIPSPYVISAIDFVVVIVIVITDAPILSSPSAICSVHNSAIWLFVVADSCFHLSVLFYKYSFPTSIIGAALPLLFLFILILLYLSTVFFFVVVVFRNERFLFNNNKPFGFFVPRCLQCSMLRSLSLCRSHLCTSNIMAFMNAFLLCNSQCEFVSS